MTTTSAMNIPPGISQPQRIPAALKPGYLQIDGRTPKDLLQFAFQYAGLLQYYNIHNQPDGDWQAFFRNGTLNPENFATFVDNINELFTILVEQKYLNSSGQVQDAFKQLKAATELKLPQPYAQQQSQIYATLQYFQEIAGFARPEFALFWTFIQLFGYAQQEINTITSRYLRFYDQDVLGFMPLPAVDDQVHVLFELAPNMPDYLLSKGTLLSAGKDAQGTALTYQTEADLVVTPAQITDLKKIYVDEQVFAAAISPERSKPWAPFSIEGSASGSSPQPATVGLAFASPLLFLQEGTRTITLNLTLSAPPPAKLKSSDFQIFLSGAKQWIQPPTDQVQIKVTKGKSPTLQIVITLDASKPAVVAYQPEVLKENFDTAWPVLKLLPNASLYPQLKTVQWSSATLRVDVQGVSSLVVQNDETTLEVSKPFYPFTAQPVLGSNFYIGSWEALQKPLTQLSLNLDWYHFPGNLATYYQAYGSVTNASFQADFSWLDQTAWQVIQNGVLLFPPAPSSSSSSSSTDSPTQSSLPVATNTITASQLKMPGVPDLPVVKQWTPTTQNGFVRLNLSAPITPFQAFGQQEYPLLYTAQSMALSKSVFEENKKITTQNLPNEPYIPRLKSLTLDYTAQQTLTAQTIGTASSDGQFFWVEPFGVRELVATANPKPLALVADYPQGQFLVGLSPLTPPEGVSILVQAAAGSANPQYTIIPQDIQWSYLSANQWQDFTPEQITSDTTFGLQASGIISFAIPASATANNTILPANQYWLRASIGQNAAQVSQLIALKTQAMTAVFAGSGVDPNNVEKPLPAGKITKLVTPVPAIKKVSQPYASFGGEPAEDEINFVTRVSERLRHKHRALTAWDYERLVLAQFPHVYKVRCLNHYDGITSPAPGYVMVVVVPNLVHQNTVNPLQPVVSQKTLDQIQEYLTPLLPPEVQLQVVNPQFEEILVQASVIFDSDKEQGYDLQQLNQDLIAYFCPWAFQTVEDINFGGTVCQSDVLYFVETRPYVAHVLNLQLYAPKNNKQGAAKQTIAAATPRTILVSAPKHQLSVATPPTGSASSRKEALCQN